MIVLHDPAHFTWTAGALVAVGAALGGVARWWIAGVFQTRDFPLGVLVVNVIGSFLLSVLVFGGVAAGWVTPQWRLFLGLGVLGGFTTMSTFAYDTIAFLDAGEFKRAAVNAIVNPAFSLAAAALGYAVALVVPVAG